MPHIGSSPVSHNMTLQLLFFVFEQQFYFETLTGLTF